jgi:ABC-2 type transport system permease protein
MESDSMTGPGTEANAPSSPSRERDSRRDSGTDRRGSGWQPGNRIAVWLRFVAAYAHANLQSALEYRVSFFTQVFAMMLNDGMWLVFWLAYFDKFQVVEGWGRAEIVTLWAVVAASFGLATTVCGNLFRLSGLIVRGELDIYLALPKPALPHMLISRMSVTAPGDVLFGIAGFAWFVQPDLGQWALFLVSIVSGAIIFTAFGIATHSLAFWLGNADAVAEQLTNALISFSTYPTPIFRGVVKVALFTLLPAGFIAYVPVQLFREFSWLRLAGLWGFAALALAVAVLIFRLGLRRYESGNLVLIRE